MSSQSLVPRQVVLPISKAVEIAYKSIRLRLSRSLLVTSGIILALAFLMSILVSDVMTSAMRKWAADFPRSERYQILSAERQSLEANPGATAGTELRLQQIREELTGPQKLQELLKNAGVPATPQDIEANRIQNRWLIGLALLVAFVGILNSMLMSVTERFREIGTMKCLGALDSFIITLFLIESLFQGVVGTILGIGLGLGLSIGSLASTFGQYARINIPWLQLLNAVLICLMVGIGLTICGALYPAWQAARMQPIDAMRVET